MSKKACMPVSMASRSVATLLLFVFLAAALCSCGEPAKESIPSPTSETLVASTGSELWEQTPYPYATPLPPGLATTLDGSYRRIEPEQPTPLIGSLATPTPPGGGAWMWHPIRPTVWVMPPAPYSVQGSGWMLSLDRGIFRISHETTGWRTLGSFAVSGNRIEFFNDPHCMKAVGRYEWTLTAEQLALGLVEDDCGSQSPFQSGPNTRAAVLTGFPWASQQPP